MRKSEVLEVLERFKLAPQKQKGQNFLINSAYSKKIVALLSADNKAVLEIGPGLGALTSELSTRFSNLTLVELDRGFAAYLEESYKDVKIITGNILKTDVPRETTAVISNLPYYITTKIIEYIVISNPHVTEFVFMTESDVINRLFAAKKTKAYGPLSIIFEITGTLTKCFDVDKANFYPIPHVNSTVFKFVRDDNNFDPSPFYHFLKSAFMARRKTLLNNFPTEKERSIIKRYLENIGLSEKARAEELSAEELFSLFKIVNSEETKQD